MAFTSEQHDALESAIAEGVLTVEYNDKKVTYRSLREMNQILLSMKQDLGLISTGTKKKKNKFDNGL